MKILYDYQIFSQVYGGVSRYFSEVVSNFKKSKDKDIDFEIGLCYSNNYNLRNSNLIEYPAIFKSINFKGKDRILNKFNRRKSIHLLRNKKFDIFHPTYYDVYFLKYLYDKPFVLTIYDMIHELFPHIFPIKNQVSCFKEILAKKAAKIIALSENTKKDIIRFYKIEDEKIEVIHLASSLNGERYKEFHNSTFPERYILFVGARAGYKNFTVFIQAVSCILSCDDTLHIVCAGPSGFTLEEIELFKSMGVEKRILHYCVDDEMLAYLYKKAIAFIFPSLYEGFGMPILEAFSCGCPVAISNSSAFPEIANDAAIYFDPHSVISMMETIRKIIYNETIRESLIKKGFDRVKNFSWEITTQKTKCLYSKVL